jgi:hypothetical protein
MEPGFQRALFELLLGHAIPCFTLHIKLVKCLSWSLKGKGPAHTREQMRRNPVLDGVGPGLTLVVNRDNVVVASHHHLVERVFVISDNSQHFASYR